MKKLLGILFCSSAVMFGAESPDMNNAACEVSTSLSVVKVLKSLEMQRGTLSIEGIPNSDRYHYAMTELWNGRNGTRAIGVVVEKQPLRAINVAANCALGVAQVRREEVGQELARAAEMYLAPGSKLAFIVIDDCSEDAHCVYGSVESAGPSFGTLCHHSNDGVPIKLMMKVTDPASPVLCWKQKK